MIQIYNFDNAIESGRKYGGMAGAKLGIILNNENWIIKFPKSTKGFNTVEISYTTTPLSEYLGSHIYETIEIPVHETILGIKDEKLVVACKDFKEKGEELYEFREVKNEYVKGLEEKIDNLSSSSGNSTDINEIMLIMNNNPTFINNPSLKDRFWDMFVVDSLIGNNDRNNGNWGILVNEDTKTTRLAPVYDNGACFNNKMSEERMKTIMQDKVRFENSAYISISSAFYDNGKIINPLKYIEKASNDQLNKAILRIMPNIDLNKIKNIIYSVPNNYEEVKIASEIVKDFYYQLIEYRYNVLLSVYNKLKN